ncbi:MAG: hypothetical protein BIFFINMI_01700 [Phycisphaerae bacterium]|nr:hypothetical protein [Phycisphaerae bacterium]
MRWIALALPLLLISSALAEDAAPAPTTRPEAVAPTTQPAALRVMHQESPQALLGSVHEATVAHDLRAMAIIIHPDYKVGLVPVLNLMAEVMDANLGLADVVEKKLDKGLADKLRGQIAPPGGSPLDAVQDEHGKVDWSKVKVTEEKDIATFAVNGEPQPGRLARVDGKWYIVPNDDPNVTPAQMAAQAAQMVPMLKTMLTATTEITDQVRSGAIKAEDFQRAYMLAMTKAMMGSMPQPPGPDDEPVIMPPPGPEPEHVPPAPDDDE